MKKVCSIIVLIILLALLFCGCGKNSFIGTFTSDWIDIQNNESSIQFILTVNKDKTVTLERKNGETTEWTKSGTWAGNNSKDNYGIICMFNKYNEKENIGGYYLTLMGLDDGRFTANPSLTLSDYGSKTCFGTGGFDYIISLVIFKKV